ncbi:DEAD/DEAH box helicase family protein [Geoalkalibacter halelectricus]|uniref:DEAD/DEAH box helicase family protein n=1 Tax=Geoalkalibacter halelectricus TaxID=2847045 RepID=A0ABY5ZRC1_9BACT|nr:DEAD/DEAH box helicase family protein [Geoalkalibacter halelectricus]UWZ79776.1 DEAD/DEAH box helicase family protein [Geoalkalibacter halelectricus]
MKNLPVTHGCSGKRLDERRLHRLALDDPRIFRRRQPRVDVHTAVCLLLDASGSMNRQHRGQSCIELASLCAYALHLALRGLPGVAVWSAEFSQARSQRFGRDAEVREICGWQEKPSPALFGRRGLSNTPVCSGLWAARAEVEEKDEKTGKKRYKQIFPRYHQLKVVRMLLADAAESGIGRRYLIQHSAGSGKSNSIAWLAHQLVGLEHDAKALFDSVIVVTDRRVLDKQIRDTIKQFAQVSATVGHAEHSGDLRRFLKAGKKIIITTVQKFPFILDEIGDEHRKSKFAIIIDEARSADSAAFCSRPTLALMWGSRGARKPWGCPRSTISTLCGVSSWNSRLTCSPIRRVGASKWRPSMETLRSLLTRLRTSLRKWSSRSSGGLRISSRWLAKRCSGDWPVEEWGRR